MSKQAIIALNHGVRRAGWAHGSPSTAVCSGYVDTDLAAAISDLPGAEMTQPDDLARLIVNTLELPNTASVAELIVNCAYENLM